MGKLMACGVFCAILSVWGVVQLVVMGIVYQMECSVFAEDVHIHHITTETYDKFLSEITRAFTEVSLNCYIAAAFYLVTLLLSIGCILRARASSEDNIIIKDCEFLDVEAGFYSLKKPVPRMEGEADEDAAAAAKVKEEPEVVEEVDDLEQTRRELKWKKAKEEAKKAAEAAEAKAAQGVVKK